MAAYTPFATSSCQKQQGKKMVSIQQATLALLAGLLLVGSLLPAAASRYAGYKSTQTVTVIEDQSCQPSAMLVSAGDHNYAMLSPNLTANGWISVAVNGKQLFILKADNTTFSGALAELDETERDLIVEARASFLQNLAGLDLNRPSYGSHYLQRPAQRSSSVIKCPLTASEYALGHQKPSYSRWRQLSAPISFYNLHDSKIQNSLQGDVYQFDLMGNVLDVYSASVSLHQATSISALYRDAYYFAYSRPCMPLTINRFVLLGNSVFFIYDDATVLVKQSSMLDNIELDLVVNARTRIRELAHWRSPVTHGSSLDQQQQSAEPELLEQSR